MISRRLHQLIYWLILLACLFAILILPSVFPVQTPAQKQATANQNNIASQTATSASIFNNNLLIGVITLIPGLGWGYIIAALYSTGVVVASYNQPWYFVLLNPFAWVELATYSFVLVQSIKLTHMFKQRKCNDFKYTTIKTIAYTFIIVTIVLLASALVEYWLIRGMA